MKRSFIKIILIPVYLFLSAALLLSCEKEDKWLDIKAVKSDVVPETLADFQALLDNTSIMNDASSAGLAGADNFYFTDADYNASDEESRNLYIWSKNIWSSEASVHWNNSFKVIEYSNIVLDGIKKIEDSGTEYRNVKGEALFHRAFATYNLAQLFCKTYTSSALSDLGLPLKKSSDVNIIDDRASLQDTYQQIIVDAKDAAALLPESQPYTQRPVNAAAYGLLAKTYLIMGDYTNAALYAGKAITLRGQLLDYNNTALVNTSTTYRFPANTKNMPEMLFYCQSNSYRHLTAATSSRALIVPELYNSYDNNDLRKTLFYSASAPTAKYRGGYTGKGQNFSGIATNEIYLIRAECFARLDNTNAALADLNLLLRNRYKTNTYINKATTNAEEALTIILAERRKELPFTSNVRWEDLRRLNKEVKFQKTLTRVVNGTTFILPPNDNRYVLPIPSLEIQLTSIQQNER